MHHFSKCAQVPSSPRTSSRQTDPGDRSGEPRQPRPDADAKRRPGSPNRVDGRLEKVADGALDRGRAPRQPRRRRGVERDGYADDGESQRESQDGGGNAAGALEQGEEEQDERGGGAAGEERRKGDAELLHLRGEFAEREERRPVAGVAVLGVPLIWFVIIIIKKKEKKRY